MAITREIINVQSTYEEDIGLCRPMFSDWQQVNDTPNTKEGVKEATYVYMGGDPQYPATIRIGCYQNANGRDNISAKLSTFTKITDDDGNITYEPYVYTMAVSGPTGGAWSGTAKRQGFENLMLFSGFVSPLATPALGAGAATDNSAAQRLVYCVPDLPIETMDDPAEA